MHFEDARVVESLRTKGYRLASKEMLEIDPGSYYALHDFKVKYSISMKNGKGEVLDFTIEEVVSKNLMKFFTLILFGDSNYIEDSWKPGFLRYGYRC